MIVFRSNTNIYTQLVDDSKNKTLLSTSSIDKELKGAMDKAKSKIEKSGIVFSLNLIIGFPGETRELIFDTIELNRKMYYED